MIADSVPWKEDLFRMAGTIEARTRQRRWTERTSYLVERDVMNAGYAIRKLIEACKLSDELVRETVRVQRYKLIGKPVDIWSRHDFFEHYDMGNPQSVQLSLSEFCNQIIHSWVWMMSVTDEKSPRFDGVFVSSDWARKRCVYLVSAQTLVEVFRAVALDDVVSIRYQRDMDGNMQIVRASRDG